MAKYIMKRLLQSLFVLWGLSVLIFFIARVVPGDPARAALGHFARAEQIEQLRQELRLDEPVMVQYYYWLASVLRGDFGSSTYTGRPVMQDIIQFLPATVELMLFATIISLIIGQLSGVMAGIFRNTWIDSVSRTTAYLGVSTPSFVVAILLLFVFSHLLGVAPGLGRLPRGMIGPPRATGFLVLDSILAGQWATAWRAFQHLLLPAFSLAFIHIAQEGRITRSSLIDNLQRDYVTAHQVHGVRPARIAFKYLLRPSIIPTVTVIGLDFAFLLSNAFLVELVFVWPGFSRYALNVMLNRDLNGIVAVVLVIGLTFALVNILVDIVVAFLDPRIRLQRREG